MHTDFLPPPSVLQKQAPLSPESAAFILEARHTLIRILCRRDPRLLLIVGPCSIHDTEAALVYAQQLRELAKKVEDCCFIVMRSYVEKPRTALGWKGLLHDPDLDGSYNLYKGLVTTRKLLSSLAALQVPAATELLEPILVPYFVDGITWGCVGARTCLSPPHRHMASALSIPIGFKNSVDGNIENAIQALITAQSTHTLPVLTPEGALAPLHAHGNPYCHLILRGGASGSNFHPEAVQQTIALCQLAGVRTRVMIDCAHDNCGKQHPLQIIAFEAALNQFLTGDSHILGMMLESYIHAGAQPITPLRRYGVSVTDPCLDWATTEELVLSCASSIRSTHSACCH